MSRRSREPASDLFAQRSSLTPDRRGISGASRGSPCVSPAPPSDYPAADDLDFAYATPCMNVRTARDISARVGYTLRVK